MNEKPTPGRPDDERPGARRPGRHLRVTVRLTDRRVRVERIWLVDGPAVSTRAPGHPILVRVDVGGRIADIGRQPDPRVHRGLMRRDVGHFFGRDDAGTLTVSVPFDAVGDLSAVRIRLLDATDAGIAATDRGELARLFDDPPARLRAAHELGYADLRATRDWVAVAARLGVRVDAGRFEIFVDEDRRYRWRMRRADGSIVAVSGQGFARRSDLVAELAWVQTTAAGLPVDSLDVTEPG